MYGNKPVEKELEAGTYYWCSCGKSSTPPFCDGSHKVTPNMPVRFELTEKKKVWLCTCGKSKTAPYCDGNHEK